MKTFLILGNGFDLNCGLKSKFSDFFETKITRTFYNLRSTETTLKEKSHENIWYIIFFFAFYSAETPKYMTDFEPLISPINNTDPLWMDLESCIKNIMLSSNERLGRYIGINNRKASYLDVFNYIDSLKNDYEIDLSNRWQFKYLQLHFAKNAKIKKNKTMPEYLFYELKLFEKDFKEYILGQINSNSKYDNSSLFLLERMREKNESFYVLSFNYTNPSLLVGDSINHVHGDLGTDIIIGCDSSEMNASSNPSLMMTKGWQKLFLDVPKSKLPKKEEIAQIKFFGHSLGEQDYSYFHSLFDYYDVYSRNVALTFYYAEHGDTPEKNEVIRAKYISSVYALLDKYVEESEKENKRKTFVGRLQLENRLRIVKL